MQRYSDWNQKFGYQLGKKVFLLMGETSVDLRYLRDVGIDLEAPPNSYVHVLDHFCVYVSHVHVAG